MEKQGLLPVAVAGGRGVGLNDFSSNQRDHCDRSASDKAGGSDEKGSSGRSHQAGSGKVSNRKTWGTKRGKYSHFGCVRCKQMKKKCSGVLPCVRCRYKGLETECVPARMATVVGVLGAAGESAPAGRGSGLHLKGGRAGAVVGAAGLNVPLTTQLNQSYTRTELLHAFTIKVAPIHLPLADGLQPQIHEVVSSQYEEEWWTGVKVPRDLTLLAEVYAAVALQSLGQTATARQLCLFAAPEIIGLSHKPGVSLTPAFVHGMFSVANMLLYQTPSVSRVVTERVLEIAEKVWAESPDIHPLVRMMTMSFARGTLNKISRIGDIGARARVLLDSIGCGEYMPGEDAEALTLEGAAAMPLAVRDKSLFRIRNTMHAVLYRILDLSDGRVLATADKAIRGLKGSDACEKGFLGTEDSLDNDGSPGSYAHPADRSDGSTESDSHGLAMGCLSDCNPVLMNRLKLQGLLGDVGAYMRAALALRGADDGIADYARKRFSSQTSEIVFCCRVAAIVILSMLGQTETAAACAADFASYGENLDFNGGGSVGSYVLPLAMMVSYARDREDTELMRNLGNMAKNLESSWSPYPDDRRTGLVALISRFLSQSSSS